MSASSFSGAKGAEERRTNKGGTSSEDGVADEAMEDATSARAASEAGGASEDGTSAADAVAVEDEEAAGAECAAPQALRHSRAT